MNNEKWGVGSKENEPAFDRVKMKGGKEIELFFGEFPHTRQDNNIYARYGNSNVGFCGHRRPFKIEIEEYNYLKESYISGDEIRKGGNVKIYCNGIQIYDEFCRNYENGYREAHNFIIAMEMNWSWFPHNLNYWLGENVLYYGQLAMIDSFIVSQSCMMLKPVGKDKFDLFPYDEKDDDREDEIKVNITDHNIYWYPKER